MISCPISYHPGVHVFELLHGKKNIRLDVARKATTSKGVGRDQHLPLLLLHLPHQQEGRWDSLTPRGERDGEKVLAQADAVDIAFRRRLMLILWAFLHSSSMCNR